MLCATNILLTKYLSLLITYVLLRVTKEAVRSASYQHDKEAAEKQKVLDKKDEFDVDFLLELTNETRQRLC